MTNHCLYEFRVRGGHTYGKNAMASSIHFVGTLKTEAAAQRACDAAIAKRDRGGMEDPQVII